jgi:hypothetical protein
MPRWTPIRKDDAKIDTNQERLEGKMDSHHEELMAAMKAYQEEIETLMGLSRKDGGHGFGGKSRRNGVRADESGSP